MKALVLSVAVVLMAGATAIGTDHPKVLNMNDAGHRTARTRRSRTARTPMS